MIKKDVRKGNVDKKGPVIPAGTEQETGLTRGQTEKPNGRRLRKPTPATTKKKGK